MPKCGSFQVGQRYPSSFVDPESPVFIISSMFIYLFMKGSKSTYHPVLSILAWAKKGPRREVWSAFRLVFSSPPLKICFASPNVTMEGSVSDESDIKTDIDQSTARWGMSNTQGRDSLVSRLVVLVKIVVHWYKGKRRPVEKLVTWYTKYRAGRASYIGRRQLSYYSYHP